MIDHKMTRGVLIGRKGGGGRYSSVFFTLFFRSLSFPLSEKSRRDRSTTTCMPGLEDFFGCFVCVAGLAPAPAVPESANAECCCRVQALVGSVGSAHEAGCMSQ